jgi:iron complex transport system substrate-binding protein
MSPIQPNIEEITEIIVDTAYQLHKRLGPGLLESVYEAILYQHLTARGLFVERQKPISFEFDGIHFDEGFRVDLLVENQVVVELKSVENILPVHGKQVLTYLKLLNLPIGLLVNFGAPMMKAGLTRIVNNYQPVESGRLNINRQR